MRRAHHDVRGIKCAGLSLSPAPPPDVGGDVEGEASGVEPISVHQGHLLA